MSAKSKQNIISKSTFLRGLQCPKSLYLNKHHPELRDKISPDQQKIFDRGHDVGKLAHDLFPGGADASPEDFRKYREAAERTQKLIQDGVKVIYEAAFIHNGALCLADILVKKGKSWFIYEVKSSTSVSDVYLLDASVQYYIITGSGLPVEDISIVYLNNQYVRQGALDVQQLFAMESVLAQAKENHSFIEDNLERLQSVLDLTEAPVIEIGEQCSNPYPCDFMGHCWKDVPDYSVFNITRIKKQEAFELYRRGIVTLDQIPADYSLAEAQKLQVECHKSGEVYIDREGIREFIEKISFPLYFMDFETFMPAVPLYDNSRPYQQIPFQYSIHYKETSGSDPLHREFLADGKGDPRPNFIERLLEDTRGQGGIMVYNKSFESLRLKELARDFPAYAVDLEERASRIIDLMEPFQKKLYYAPSMQGSYSIKKVLPALVPDMGYDGMEIAEGGAAMEAYEQLMGEVDSGKIARIRKNLLEYCKMDTMAMVRVLERLENIIK